MFGLSLADVRAFWSLVRPCLESVHVVAVAEGVIVEVGLVVSLGDVEGRGWTNVGGHGFSNVLDLAGVNKPLQLVLHLIRDLHLLITVAIDHGGVLRTHIIPYV